jgi:biotin carboxyl carrier protein
MATVTIGGRKYEVEVRGQTVVVDGHEFPIKLQKEEAHTTVTAGGVRYRVQLPDESERQSGMEVQVDYRPFVVEYEGRLGGGPAARPERSSAPRSVAAAPAAAVKGGVSAQIAGRVVSVKVSAGQAVKAGDVLLLLEAMKMENEIKAPSDGTVKEVRVSDGQRVAEGETLIVLE